MTVIGFAKTRDGAAFAWADSESYRDGAPIPTRAVKMGVSSGGIIGVGTGFAEETRRFCNFVEGFGAANFAQVVASLPICLRDAHRQKRRKCVDFDIEYVNSSYGVCGWERGEVRGAIFRELRDFEPVAADAWFSPYIDLAPQCGADVLTVAQAQMRVIRRLFPRATGKTLSVARIGVGKVALAHVPLLIENVDERL